ncbi:MAG: ATPase [Acidobacteria bacterium]|nr:ATPase [Acidobacteriota bacterium]
MIRARAANFGLTVPDFVHVLNHDALRRYMARVPPPWLLKPPSEASAIGIRKISRPDELWPVLGELGDRQSYFLLERDVAGDVYHVDAIVAEREPVFGVASRYARPPMDVAHHGGVFITRTLGREEPDARALPALNRDVLRTLGFVRGVTHTEYIKGRDDGRFYFLETAARVGGANIVEVIEAATGVNLWAEWAKVEVRGEAGGYRPPPAREDYAGIIMSLARQQQPDTSAYTDPEIVRRTFKHHHAGMIVASSDPARVQQLLDEYSRRFYDDFFATAPLPSRPTV